MKFWSCLRWSACAVFVALVVAIGLGTDTQPEHDTLQQAPTIVR